MKYFISVMLLLASLSAMSQTYSKDLEKSAKNGDVTAQCDLGICYLNGLGTKVDYKKAFEYLCVAAADNDGRAQYYIAQMFENQKVDLSKDKQGNYKTLVRSLNPDLREISRIEKGYGWYIISAYNGYVEGQLRTAKLYREMGDEATAIEWFKKASAQGNKEAEQEYKTFTNKLAASGIELKENDLLIMSDVQSQDYVRDEHERIIIMNTVKNIGYGAFEFAKAKEIIFQEGDDLLTIETAAFGFGERHNQWPRDPKEIVFNRPVDIKPQAFMHCCPKLLVFKKDVQGIGSNAFGKDKGIERVEFNKVPQSLDKEFINQENYKINCKEVVVPKGTVLQFKSLGIPNEIIKESK